MNKLKEMVLALRQQGLKKAWQMYKWKLLLAVFCYYLVRDVFLYIIVPFFIIKSVQSASSESPAGRALKAPDAAQKSLDITSPQSQLRPSPFCATSKSEKVEEICEK